MKTIVKSVTLIFLIVASFSQTSSTFAQKLKPLKVEPFVAPDSFDFGFMPKGMDSCTTFQFWNYLVGANGSTDPVLVTNITFLHHDQHFSISPPFTKNISVAFGE